MDPIKPEVVEPTDEKKGSPGGWDDPFDQQNPWVKLIKPPKPDPRWSLLWCVLGGSLSAVFPVIAMPLIAYGMRILSENKQSVRGVLASVLPATAYLATSIEAGLVAIVIACLACVCGKVPTKYLRASALIAVSLLGALGFIGIEFVGALASNMDIASYVNSQVVSVFDQVSGVMQNSSPEAMAMMQDAIHKVWPAAFYIQAFIYALFGFWGAGHADRRLGVEKPFHIVSYDTPLWAVVLLIGGVVAAALGMATVPYAEVIGAIGLNVLLISRMTFAVQGLGVLSWFVNSRPMGCLMRIVIIMLAFWLEMSLMALTIFGLVDVWANFRKLDRKEHTS